MMSSAARSAMAVLAFIWGGHALAAGEIDAADSQTAPPPTSTSPAEQDKVEATGLPQQNEGSESRLHRNGIGLREDGLIVLLMTEFHSDKRPNLWEFAGAFLALDCPDALFLDGDLCQMRTGAGMREPGNHMGSYIVVVEEEEDNEED